MAMLSLIVLKTQQLDSLFSFYTALGIELIEEQHGKGPVHYAGRIGDAVFEVYPLPDKDTEADTTTRLGFVIQKLDETIDKLEAMGVTIITKPKNTDWGYRAVVRDPDGRSVELYEEGSQG